MDARPVKGAGRHVLMTADAVGGVWTYALDLGAALARRGDLVTLAVLGPAPTDGQRADAAARGLPLRDLGHPPDWLAGDAGAVKKGGRALARLAGRVGADLLHLNHPALGAAGRFPCPTLAVTHSCLATWWEAVRGGEPLPDDFRWRAALHEAGMAAADALAAPSRAFAEATRRVYGFGEAPSPVPNGRNAPPAAAEAQPAPSVLTAGRLWDEGKNLATLDRAAARLPVSVEAAGPLEGPNGARALLRHTAALGVLDKPAMRAKLAARPIFVSPALYEPFGLSVLEAAQAGCALVLSDIPTFRELWDDAALFVPPHDDRALAAAVVRLLGDRAYRAECAELSRARAGRFTVDAMAAATARAYAAAAAAFESAGPRPAR